MDSQHETNQNSHKPTKKQQQKRPRAPNWTEQEWEMLKNEVDKRKGILFAAFSNIITYKLKQEEWGKVTNAVNVVGGNDRTVSQIKTKWTNEFSTAKKKLAKDTKERRKTGGGPSETQELNSEEDRLASIIGTERIEGIQGGIDSDDIPLGQTVEETSSNGTTATTSDSTLHEDNVEAISLTVSDFLASQSSSSSQDHDRSSPTFSTISTLYSEPSILPTPTSASKEQQQQERAPKKRKRVPDDAQDQLLSVQKDIFDTLEKISQTLNKQQDDTSMELFQLNGNVFKLVQVQNARLEIEKQQLEVWKKILELKENQHYSLV